MSRFRSLVPILVLASLISWSLTAAELELREQSLELPGAPASLLSADLDGDGLRDLVVVTVATAWDQIGIEERTEMDQVEGLVEVLTIVPVLLDRREIRVYRGLAAGGFASTGEAAELPLSVLTLETGPPGAPLVALTDAGVSVLRLGREAGSLRFEPSIASPPVLAGIGAYLAGLDLVTDVTGDGVVDLLVPLAEGLAIHPGAAGGLASDPVAIVPLPGPGKLVDSPTLDYPLPRALDVDGDGLADLLFRTPPDGTGSGRIWMARNLGGGRFAPALAIEPVETRDGGAAREGLELVHLGRLQPEGPATAVYLEALDDPEAGLREEMRQARAPDHRLHRYPAAVAPVARSGTPEVPPQQVRGYVPANWVGAGGGEDFTLPGGFQDLNGDGRTDLVTVTNDITLFKAMAVLATRRLTLDLGFHPWCQGPDGRFARAPGPPLESRLAIDLDDIELRRRSLFAGDFDGDGRADFLQLGRPKRIGVHLGRADCSYSVRPNAEIVLRDPIRDLALVEVQDLDGDGRDDLAVTHPQRLDEVGVTPPVRLDLYLSRTGGPAAGGAR